MKLSIYGAAAAAALLACAAPAQQPDGGAPAPGCAENLDAMRDKLQANYAGYLLEVRDQPARRAEYESTVAALRVRAAGTEGDACFYVLRDLVDWFRDPHLFVFQSARMDTAQTARRARETPRLAVTEAGAREYLAAHAERLDPIEGIWYDGPLRVAIVPEPDAGPGRFVAVVLHGDTALWEPGMVRARLRRTAAGEYEADVAQRGFALHHLRATLHRGVLLRTSPGMWGRAFPRAAEDGAGLHPDDPRRPTLVSRGGTVVVSLPSHAPGYRRALDSLVAASADALRDAELLVVDLRGNEGGSAATSNALLPYIASENQAPPAGNFGDAVMLASPDQMAYARRAFGPDTLPFVRQLLARMEAAPGALVPLDPPVPVRRDTVVPGARRVAVITDRGTVSAAEVLVLEAMRSPRVTVFGEPTAGALDYQSTSIVPLHAGERRWFLGYPTIAASARLPEGGMRGRGIAPQVPLDLASIADVVAHVEGVMRSRP